MDEIVLDVDAGKRHVQTCHPFEELLAEFAEISRAMEEQSHRQTGHVDVEEAQDQGRVDPMQGRLPGLLVVVG